MYEIVSDCEIKLFPQPMMPFSWSGNYKAYTLLDFTFLDMPVYVSSHYLRSTRPDKIKHLVDALHDYLLVNISAQLAFEDAVTRMNKAINKRDDTIAANLATIKRVGIPGELDLDVKIYLSAEKNTHSLSLLVV